MLIFEEGGKPENPEKNPRSKDENQQQTQPTYDTGSRIQTQATLVGGECDHHCAIPAPQNSVFLLNSVTSIRVNGILTKQIIFAFNKTFEFYLAFFPVEQVMRKVDNQFLAQIC